MGGHIADDQQFDARPSRNSNAFGDALPRRHPAHDDEIVLRRLRKRNLVHVDAVVDDRQGLVAKLSGLRLADTDRNATGEIPAIVLVDLSFDISVSEKGWCLCEGGEIGGQGWPMGVDDVETVGLAVKIVRISRLELFLQIKSRLGVIKAGHRKNRLDRTIHL